ncbi:hypothetical protein HanXRQr2_Chr09g0368101 [Helianthus annuus]|uniref:Uncharacterized protein n=1 Tax=Helianthus annuus TaxID=4232 RepID=A0A251TTP3_HELAN|nr:hypothetical protein HanXRQr2_Chr09g0368101 [Helianthus annuus]KAJ0891486.1 hypothetical protein HanPSC8_Chr09g0354421 [Helianthus annuus]
MHPSLIYRHHSLCSFIYLFLNFLYLNIKKNGVNCHFGLCNAKRFEFWTKVAKVTKPQGPKWQFTQKNVYVFRDGYFTVFFFKNECLQYNIMYL